MRAAEASQHARKFDDDGMSLKPQWLKDPRTSGGGISNQFRSADQFRGRGGRKPTDERRLRRQDPKISSSLTSPSDFPPLPPFYRSHSTGSLTPADTPSASSRLLSATKEGQTYSINRECDFPTLATAAAVEQPTRMNKSKSATALPQAISPSSDLLKACHPSLPVAVSSPSHHPTTPAVSPDPPPPRKAPKEKAERASFSEVAAAERARSNKDKFQLAMANSRAELQRFKSLVPSKPVHPALAIANRPRQRPKPSASVLNKPPAELLPSSPATMRKATSAPVLPMSSHFPRSPPNPSPLATISSTATPSSSSSPPSASSSVSSSSPPRPAFMSSSQSARTLPQATIYSDSAPPAKPQHHLPSLPLSRFPTNSNNSGISPRRRDSMPATSSASSRSSSPLPSPRHRGEGAAVGSPSAPLSPRAQSTPSANDGASKSATNQKAPLRHSGPSKSSPATSASASSAKQQQRPVAQPNGEVRRRSLDRQQPQQQWDDEEEDKEWDAEPTGNGAGSCGSSNNNSCSDDSESEHSDHDDEVMMIATGMTNMAGFYNLRPQIEGVVEEEENPPQLAAADEFCPFSWEMRADGEEWSEWSEDAVTSFMAKELGYVPQDAGEGAGGEDEGGLTEEEIRLAKQQMEANLQQLLEKKKRGLSESLQKKFAAGSALASPSSPPTLLPSSSPAPRVQSPASSSSTYLSSSSSPSRRRNQPLRSAGRTKAAHNHRNLHREKLKPDLVDSDTDDSDGEELHGFHGIVFG